MHYKIVEVCDLCGFVHASVFTCVYVFGVRGGCEWRLYISARFFLLKLSGCISYISYWDLISSPLLCGQFSINVPLSLHCIQKSIILSSSLIPSKWRTTCFNYFFNYFTTETIKMHCAQNHQRRKGEFSKTATWQTAILLNYDHTLCLGESYFPTISALKCFHSVCVCVSGCFKTKWKHAHIFISIFWIRLLYLLNL